MRVVASTLLILAATAIAPPDARPDADSLEFASANALRHYAQGRLLEAQGRGVEAMGEYYRALMLDPESPAVALRASETSARLGEHARSLELAERALRQDPESARAQWLRGAALFNLERPGEALEPLITAAEADSGRLEYLQTLARVAEHVDRLDWVLWAYRRAVRVDEYDGESWFQLAAAEARTGDFGRADTAMTRALELNPLRPGANFLNGWIQESLGRGDTAAALYRQHLQVHPSDLTARRRLLNVLIVDERYDEAYQQAQAIVRQRPGDVDALEIEADMAFRAGHPSQARSKLDVLERIDPEDPEVFARVAAVYAGNGLENEAKQTLERWTLRNPGDYRAALGAAQRLALRNEIEPALAMARQGVEASPDSLAPRILLGRIYQREERYEEAALVWLGILERDPRHTPTSFNLAYCREQQGDLVSAEKAVRDVLAREPDSAEALNFLGYLFADHNLKLEEAERLVRRAVEKEPDNGAYIDSLGWVYYRLGRLQEAREQLERAVQLTGGDPVVREHLGDVYNELNLKDLAKEQYRLSLAADGSNDRVRGKLGSVE